MMYYLKKLAAMLATLVVVSSATFFALNILPGDPATLILGTEADELALATLRQQLGLNQPALLRYVHWLGGLLRGELGESITFSRGYAVSALVASALPVTVALALAGVTLALAIAIPLGVAAASRQGGTLDSIILTLSQAGLAMPSFWLGILLIQFVALRLGWLPPGGMPDWHQPVQVAQALVLPAFTLALPRAAILTRIIRTTMLETLGEDYIRTARSKGLPRHQVLYSHAFRNTLVAVSTVAGIHLVQLLAGTVVVEQVFSLPGLGRMLLAAVLQRDFPLVQGLVFAGTALIVLANFALDIIYPLLDPRIRAGEVENYG